MLALLADGTELLRHDEFRRKRRVSLFALAKSGSCGIYPITQEKLSAAPHRVRGAMCRDGPPPPDQCFLSDARRLPVHSFILRRRQDTATGSY